MTGRKIIDSHTHLMLDERNQLGTSLHSPADYRDKVRGLGVERAATLVVAPRAEPDRTRELNDFVLGLARQPGGLFFPVCSVHPADGEAAAGELRRVAAEGARWIKLHPNSQEFDVADPAVTAVVRTAAGLGLPVLFDAYSPVDPAQPGKFVNLAMEVPEARLILAHAHGPNFAALLVYHVLKLYPWWRSNVWVDTSMVASLMADGPYAEQLLWVLRKFGTDRVLFGSDYPLYQPGGALDAITGLGFTDDELDAILYGNAAALLDG